MPHKVIKYRLTESGSVPTFLKFGVSQRTSGMYAVQDDTASPRNLVMIGISEDGADTSDAVAEITSQSDLQTYLSDQATANSWTDIDAAGDSIAFDASAHAQRVWDDLTALNG